MFSPRLRRLLPLAALLAVSCGSLSADEGGKVDRKPRLVDGLSIRDVAIFQAVKVKLVENGTPVTDRPVPVLVGRGGILRVYVDLAEGWTPREVTGELVLEYPDAAPRVVTDVRTISQPSSDDAAGSCFEFFLTDGDVAGDTSYQVRLITPESEPMGTGQSHPARYPADGTSASFTPLFDDAGGLNLVLVPVRYDTDGSGRLPDLTGEQLARYEGILRTMYPLVSVNITIRDEVSHTAPDSWYGFDFDTLNTNLMDLRAADGAPDDAYYYGLVNPADTFNKYCGAGCVLGQSFLVSRVRDADLRVGAGVGFPGEESAITLAHEVGHQHGREHAPCDVPDPDPSYPYSGGSIGTWGYDLRAESFQDPSSVTDFMGYCQHVWTSDYTYVALWNRILEVNALPRARVRGPVALGSALALAVAPDGALAPRRTVRLHDLPEEGRRPAVFRDAAGQVVLSTEASLVRHAHGGTGTLLVTEPPAGATLLEVATWDLTRPERLDLR